MQLSVADVGALPNDALDDGWEFQHAIDVVGAAGGGDVYVPPGEWLIDRRLRLHHGVNLVGATHAQNKCMVRRIGAGGTLIDCGDYWGGHIRSLNLIGHNGHVIDYNLTNNAHFSDIFTHTDSDHWGFYGYENTFDCVMTNIRCTSPGWVGNGLMLAGHTYVFGFSAAGCNEAIRIASPAGLTSIQGFRIEVNRIGIRAGWDKDGTATYTTLSLRDGTFESNGTAILARGTQLISNVQASAFPTAYPYTGAEHGGIELNTSYGSELANVVISSYLDTPSLVLGDTRSTRFQNVIANAFGNARHGWQMQHPEQVALNTFEYTNFPLAPRPRR